MSLVRRVRPIRLCHVALNIPKAGREQAVSFYTQRLGFVPTDRVRDVGRLYGSAEGLTERRPSPAGEGLRHTAQSRKAPLGEPPQ